MRLDEEAFDQLSFENSTIYVQKLTESDQHNYTVDESCKQTNSEEDANADDVEISVTTMKSSFKQMVSFIILLFFINSINFHLDLLSFIFMSDVLQDASS